MYARECIYSPNSVRLVSVAACCCSICIDMLQILKTASKWWCGCWKWLITFTNRHWQVDAVLFVAAHCSSICKSMWLFFPWKLLQIVQKRYQGIRGFTYSICNLDMDICTSTTLALKKVSSYVPFLPSDKASVHQYTGHVKKKSKDAIVVSDGFSGASTKDMTYRQRAKGKKGSTVSFTLEMCLTITKEN